jgi:CRP-like cAMP-binding protein
VSVADDDLTRNHLLAQLDDPVRERIGDRATLEPLIQKRVLFEQNTRIEAVIFPLAGVCSLLSVMDGDRSVEVATVGNEGFVGLPVFLQATLSSSHLAMVQIPGEAVTLPAAEFLDLSNAAGGGFQTVLQRYAQALISQIAQNAACNQLHDIEQRCARWLLMTHDRVDGDDFELTQEFLGQMLGAPRQAVGATQSAFEEAGLINYTRGAIAILDRQALEHRVCECYGLIRQEFDRLLLTAD